MPTPWQILRQLPDLARHLKPGITGDQLEIAERSVSDLQAAKQMQAAKQTLLAGFQRRKSA